MAGRKPIKNKHEKNLKNYEVTDLTSEDVMYTTESYSNSQYESGKRKNNDIYTSHDTYEIPKRYEKYDSGDSRAYDSYTYDEQETSFTSYEDRNRSSPSPSRSRSKRRLSTRRFSPSYEPSSEISSYFVKEEIIGRKNTRHSRSPERNAHSGMRYDKIAEDMNGKKRRKHESIDESEEADFNYNYSNLQKPKRNKENSLRYQEKYDEHNDVARKKNRFGSNSRETNKQVYAYQEPKQHDVFINKRGRSKDSLLSPGVHLKTNEYPVLVFKDFPNIRKGSKKLSDTVYLPVLVVGAKKNRNSSQNSPNQMESPQKQEDFLVYTANLNNQKNIFQANPDLGIKKIQHDQAENKSNKRVSQDKHKITRPVQDDSSGNRAEQIGNIIKDNRDIVNYQVNIDVEKENQSIFGGRPKSMARKSAARKSNVMSELEYKQISEDPLHDNFPVTKDYIKVNENVPGENQSAAFGKKSISRIGNSSMSKSVDMDTINRTSRVSKVSAVKPGLHGESVFSHVFPKEEEISTNNKSQFSALYKVPENVRQSETEKEPFQDKRKSRVTSDNRRSLVNQPDLKTTSATGENQSLISGKKSVSRIGNRSMSKSVDMDTINRTSRVSTVSAVKPGLSKVSAVNGEPEYVGQSNTEEGTTRTSRVSKVSAAKPGLSKVSALYVEPENDGQSDMEEAHKGKSKSKVTTESLTNLVNTPVLETTNLPGENKPLTSGEKSMSRIGNTSMTKSVDMGNINRTSRVSKVSKAGRQGDSVFSYVLPKEEESPCEIPNEELQSNTKPTMKGITNTLLNMNRIQPPTKPYEEKSQNLSIVREMHQSKSKGPQDMNSMFVKNIEPLSTLEKNEQEIIQSNSIALHENPDIYQSIGRKSTLPHVQSYEQENPPTNKQKSKQNSLWSKIKSIGSKSQLSPTTTESNLSALENPTIYQSNLESNSSKFRFSALQENPRQYQSSVRSKKSKSKSSIGSISKSILAKNKSKDRNKNKKEKQSNWSILKKSRTAKPKNETSLVQHEDPTPYYVPNEDIQLIEERGDKTDVQEEPHDKQLMQEQSCDCVSKYVTYLRECTHFFLGRTLHEEFMNILTIIKS